MEQKNTEGKTDEARSCAAAGYVTDGLLRRLGDQYFAAMRRSARARKAGRRRAHLRHFYYADRIFWRMWNRDKAITAARSHNHGFTDKCRIAPAGTQKPTGEKEAGA